MKFTKIVLIPIFTIIFVLTGCQSQSAFELKGTNEFTSQKNNKIQYLLLNETALDDLKSKYKSGDASVTAKIYELKKCADKALKGGPYSVTYKTATPPSGNKHDYMSIGIYWWPDSTKADGKPYVNKDGYINPEVNNNTYDKKSYGTMGTSVQTLALAYFYTGKEEYADYAAKLLRTWFLDSETKMNPNLNFGQAIPGITDGRGEGIIETENLSRIIDSAIMLKNNSKAFTEEDMAKFKAWVADYLKWLMESKIGKDEDNAKNNHGIWFDAATVTYAIFTGQDDLAKKIINEKTKIRIGEQIQLDGTMPLELARTRSLHYSIYAVRACATTAILADKEGIDLWNYKSANGAGLCTTIDFLKPYLDGTKTWEREQVVQNEDESLFVPILRCAALKYKDSKYLIAANMLLKNSQDSTFIDLWYPEPKIEEK